LSRSGGAPAAAEQPSEDSRLNLICRKREKPAAAASPIDTSWRLLLLPASPLSQVLSLRLLRTARRDQTLARWDAFRRDERRVGKSLSDRMQSADRRVGSPNSRPECLGAGPAARYPASCGDLSRRLRRSPRKVASIPVRLHCEEPERFREEETETRVLSRHGASLECQQPAEPGEMLWWCGWIPTSRLGPGWYGVRASSPTARKLASSF
jgi:hypothetical protein